jgi:hypothetical protein
VPVAHPVGEQATVAPDPLNRIRLLPTGLGLFVPIGRQRLIGGLYTVRLSRSACARIGLFTDWSFEGEQVRKGKAPRTPFDPVVIGRGTKGRSDRRPIGLPTSPIP